MAIDAGKDIGGALTRKIGPLPAVVWLGLLGVVAYLYQRRKGAGGQEGQGILYLPRTVTMIQSPHPLEGEEDPGPSPPEGDIYMSRKPGRHHGSSTVRRMPESQWWIPGGSGDSGLGDSPDHPQDFTGMLRLPGKPVRPVRSKGGGQAHPGTVNGQRATARHTALRKPLSAAHRAAGATRGLLGLAALQTGTGAQRPRSTMPPARALRNRPAPPRITDPGKQRNVKHEAHSRG